MSGLRQAMAWLHTWSALLPGWVLYFMFLTGTAGYFYHEIDRWMRPELPLQTTVEPTAFIADGLQQLQRDAPDAARWLIELPDRGATKARFMAFPHGAAERVNVIEYGANDAAATRETGGGAALYQMHWGLHYVPRPLAYWIVGICAMSLLIALISGLIVHRHVFQNIFTFRPGKGVRSWLDAHTVLGVMALPFYFMVAYTGLVLFMSVYLPQLMQETNRLDGGEAQLFNRAFNQMDAHDLADFQLRRANVRARLIDVESLIARVQQGGSGLVTVGVFNPGDVHARVVIVRKPQNPLSRREYLILDGVSGELIYAGAAPFRAAQVNQVLTGLHEAIYAGPLLRWLYFLSGLMGAGMLGTGLVLWTLKRRGRHASARATVGLALVERLNVAVIAGLPVAIAAYFWANRLMPARMVDRAEWEIHILFATWAVLALYGAARPLLRGWFELLCLAAAAYGLLPLLNALTTERHLGVTLSHDRWRGDWALAGFDLTVLGLGLMFAVIAAQVRRRVEIRSVQSSHAPVFASWRMQALK